MHVSTRHGPEAWDAELCQLGLGYFGYFFENCCNLASVFKQVIVVYFRHFLKSDFGIIVL